MDTNGAYSHGNTFLAYRAASRFHVLKPSTLAKCFRHCDSKLAL